RAVISSMLRVLRSMLASLRHFPRAILALMTSLYTHSVVRVKSSVLDPARVILGQPVSVAPVDPSNATPDAPARLYAPSVVPAQQVEPAVAAHLLGLSLARRVLGCVHHVLVFAPLA